MMIHDIPKPEISADCTIEDIRKIREWQHEMLKDATPQEFIEFYNKGINEVQHIPAQTE